jgi:hypothetical protein
LKNARSIFLVTGAFALCATVIAIASIYLSRVPVAPASGGGGSPALHQLTPTPSSPRPQSADPESQKSPADERAAERVAIAEAQKRLDASADRIEQRLSKLEQELKQARLIPLTKEENELELQRANEVLGEVRARLAREKKEADRLALALHVPEAVMKLSPNDAINEPRYQYYRAYFEAKIAAGYTEGLVAASEQSIAHLVIRNANEEPE